MIEINDKLKIFFPLKLKPRAQQLDGFNFVTKSVNNGKKFMLLNLPTGVGKSYFVNMFANWYKNFVNEEAKFDILTNSKILQKQYIKENPFIKNIEGRANYQCIAYDTDCDKGMEICKNSVPKCSVLECPYKFAKQQWLTSDIGLTNFHLFNTYAIYQRDIFENRESSVLFLDESHSYEEILSDYISVDITSRNMKKFGFDTNEIQNYDERIKMIKTLQQFIYFIQNFIPDVEKQLIFLEEQLKLHPKNKKLKEEYSKYILYGYSHKSKMEFLILEYQNSPENWVLEVSKNEREKHLCNLIFEVKPVWVNKYINEKIWDKYDHIIFMSGTILDKDVFCFVNGLNEKNTTYFQTHSPFLNNHRPIFYIKVGKMTKDEKQETFQKQLPWIEKILNRNKDKKGIIHCTTYEISNWLKEIYHNDPRFLFHTNEDRDVVLEKHINSTEPTVLISPSMVSGIDLKDELSRFQIILKIPFPYLGSAKIQQRKKTYPAWYLIKTIEDLCQAYGRSVRNEKDWAETYILDTSFSDIMKYNSKYLPRWVTEAIRTININQ